MKANLNQDANRDGPLQIELDHFHLQPFQELRGRIRKTGSHNARSLRLRLFWFTRGRGDEDTTIVEEQTIAAEQVEVGFLFKLPEGPYSFAGQLITLAWAVELVDEKENALDFVPFLLSPTGEEIQLEAVANQDSAKGTQKWFQFRQK